MKLFARLSMTWIGFLIIASCATSPTGRRQLMLVDGQQMDQMGAQAFEELKKQTKISQDPAQNAYVKCIAKAITTSMAESGQWEVVVFQDDTANAFALPGRKIGVHTGLLKVARTQDQLASVMGHEVGHVIANHSAERYSQQAATQSGMQVAGAVTGSILDPNGLGYKATMGALGVGAQVGILMRYGRGHETEADVIGLDLMSQAGFNPEEAVQLWRNMAAAAGGKSGPEWLSTHPSSDTRIQELQAKMSPALQKYQAAQAAGRRPNCRL
jgi:predicted Zn-dependent protease